jgi:hypothetical protein
MLPYVWRSPMRIAKTPNYIPYVPLRKDVSKAMIAGGVFDHGPNEVIWALPVNPQPTVAKPTPVDAAKSGTREVPVVEVAKPMTADEMLAVVGRVARPKPGLIPNSLKPQFATFSPTLSLSPVKLPKAGALHPVEVPKRGSKKVERVFSIAEAALPLANELSKKPAIGQSADAVAGLVAGAEIFYELVNPKDRSTLEAAFFYAQKGASVANSVVSLIPALHSAKPALEIAVTLIKVGDEVRILVQPEDKGTDKTPKPL